MPAKLADEIRPRKPAPLVRGFTFRTCCASHGNHLCNPFDFIAVFLVDRHSCSSSRYTSPLLAISAARFAPPHLGRCPRPRATSLPRSGQGRKAEVQRTPLPVASPS